MTNNNGNTKKKPPPTQRDRYLEDDDYGERNSPFIQFYMDHISLVPRVVKKTCPEEEVEDITRRVWERVYKAWPLKGIDNYEAYLTRAAKNEVAMFLRERSAQKRPPPAGRRPLPDEQPSGADLDAAFIKNPELSGNIDAKNLTENFKTLGEELSTDTSDIMKRFLERPSGVSDAEFRKLARKAEKKIKELGADIDSLKEGPSFLGHIANKIRGKKGG